MYCITATVVHHTTNKNCLSWDRTYQIPTFYLSEAVLGVVSPEHAEKVARDIICPMTNELQYEAVTVHVHVERIEEGK